MQIGRYKSYFNEETKLYDIYEVYGKYIVSCTSEIETKNVMILLENNTDKDIIRECNRLNKIQEPANRSSVLHTPIANKVRDIIRGR